MGGGAVSRVDAIGEPPLPNNLEQPCIEQRHDKQGRQDRADRYGFPDYSG